MGPTASGKTDLALQLIQHLPADIISVDSAMVYQDMNIGTAKPSPQELAAAPHRLIDLCSPESSYSAGDFCRDAACEIAEIQQHQRIPLLVGGTYLYFWRLLHGMSELPVQDAKIRAHLQQLAQERGWDFLYQQLQAIDPERARAIHPNDQQRILRALEIYQATGEKPSHIYQQRPGVAAAYDIKFIQLIPAVRANLHQKIALRFHMMLAAGLIEEVEFLQKKYQLQRDLPAMRAVGYRQVWDYLAGCYSKQQLETLGIIATQQLAKRQMTWARRWTNCLVLDELAQNPVEKILKYAQL